MKPEGLKISINWNNLLIKKQSSFIITEYMLFIMIDK